MPMLKHIIIRDATEKDRAQLKSLFEECFGQMAENDGALSRIDGRYKVAELITDCTNPSITIKPEILAVSGIIEPKYSDYDGYEITWTCTKKAYRKKGLIVKILKLCESELPDDGESLFCNCWRVRDNENVNLHSVMRRMEMECVIKGQISRVNPYNNYCKNCCERCSDCFCFGDLYMKKRDYINH